MREYRWFPAEVGEFLDRERHLWDAARPRRQVDDDGVRVLRVNTQLSFMRSALVVPTGVDHF